MIKNISLSLVLVGFASCSEQEEGSSGIFFGGQIINPSSNHITLYRDNVAVDSLILNKDFRFEKKYDSLKRGIYILEHVPEYQTVFFEKGDSIWVRINASAFKESIVYSGKGSSKNNFLINLFLQQEKEDVFLCSEYSNDSDSFNSIIDSLLNEKKEIWNKMNSSNSLSPYAQKITRAAYIYPYAARRERYALLRGSNWSEEENELFFQFRKRLNYGDSDLALFKPYVNYLMNYINEKALDSGEYCFNTKNIPDFNIRKLNILDNEISGTALRNNLARAIAFEELFCFDNQQQHSKFLERYSAVNTSDKHLSEVLDLYSDISRMQPKQPLPIVKLQDTEQNLILSDKLSDGKRKTVIYFWSQTQMSHYKKTIERVSELSKKFPEYKFIGICIQPFNPMVFQVQKMMGIDSKDQYAVVDLESVRETWALILFDKVIVIDPKSNIIEGFGNFSNVEFEAILAGN